MQECGCVRDMAAAQIASLQAELAAAKSVPPNGTANGVAPTLPDGYFAAMLRVRSFSTELGRLHFFQRCAPSKHGHSLLRSAPQNLLRRECQLGQLGP